ncbi:glycosyltransferase [Neobacillus bataviensis]|uniref:glycosyltransferase n=1 Tax=Neobacillus bataviensis TaxID=220685 RepID=UPI001CBD92E7|nr:glycosyltransferase [Neobacillus bataviensis]
MKTIGHITTEYLPITETFVYHQIVRNSQFRNVVFTRKITNEQVFPINHLVRIQKEAELTNMLRKYQVDALHSHFGPSALYALQAKETLGIPMLTFFHGYDARKYPFLNNKVQEYQRLFTIGELFLTPSNAIKEELLSMGCPENKVRVSHLGIDINQFHYQPRTLDDKEKTIRIVSVGRLVEKKGHHLLLEALSIVKKKMSHFHLTIVGEGREYQNLVDQINRLKLHDHIHLAGKLHHSEVKSVLDKAHIFCLASVSGKDGDMEGLPVSILESQASGLPIVSTRHSGIPEGVVEGKSAILAEENNPTDLANKLLEMMSQPEKWIEFGSAGREWVVQHFNAEKQAEELRDIYFELLGNDRK